MNGRGLETGDRRPETGPVLYFQLFGVERAMERWNGKDCSNMQLRWPEAMQRILQRPGKNVQVKNKLSFEWLAALCVCVLHIMRVPFLGPFFFSRLVGWAGLSPAAGRSLAYFGRQKLWFQLASCGNYRQPALGVVLKLHATPVLSFVAGGTAPPRPLPPNGIVPGQLSKHVPCKCNKLPGRNKRKKWQ